MRPKMTPRTALAATRNAAPSCVGRPTSSARLPIAARPGALPQSCQGLVRQKCGRHKPADVADGAQHPPRSPDHPGVPEVSYGPATGPEGKAAAAGSCPGVARRLQNSCRFRLVSFDVCLKPGNEEHVSTMSANAASLSASL